MNIGYLLGIFGPLMALVVLIPLITSFDDAATDGASLDQCRNSVLLRDRATLSESVSDLEQLTPLNCGTQDVQPGDHTKAEEREQISDLMAQCWYMFAEGRVDDVFKAKPGSRQCHICYNYLPSNTTSSQDIIDYMRDNQVNPTDYRTISGSEYMGDGVDLQTVGTPSGRLALEDIQAPSLSDYVDDPGGYLSEDEEQRVNDLLNDILRDGNAAGQVLVAGDITDLSRANAHDTMRRLSLTAQENTTRGFLLTVDLADQEARLDLGKDLNTDITPQGISTILEPLTNANKGTIGEAVVTVVERLKQRFNEDTSVERGSYYAYLTRGGQATPVLPKGDIEANTPYAVAYVSPSDDQENYWFEPDGFDPLTNNELEGTRNFIAFGKFRELSQRCEVRA